MKTILVDMDSILADFYFEVLRMYEAETGDKPDPHCLSAWDLKLPNGKTCFPYFSQPGFFRGLKPIPGAQRVLKRLHDEGHEIVIVSSATLTNAPAEKYEWLSEHFPWIHRDKVIFAKEKFRVHGDILIDDHHENVRAWREYWLRTLGRAPTTVGIEYPYNRERSEHSYMARSFLDFEDAWAQIDAFIHGLIHWTS